MFSRERKTPLAEWWWTVDRQLLAALIVLLAVGVALSFATSPPVAERLGNSPWHFIIRHIIFVVPTLFVLIGASFLKERMARFAALFLLVGSMILLMATPFVGMEANGARRWILIFGQSLQPSEFVKPAYAIIAAWLFAEAMQRGDVPGKTIAFIVAVLIVVPLVLQPDIGQTVLIVATFSALLFLSGISWWLIVILAGVGAVMGVGAYMFFPHVARRIDGFLDQDAGPSYQVEKALQSLLEGGWFGRGPGEAVAKRYLPELRTLLERLHRVVETPFDLGDEHQTLIDMTMGLAIAEEGDTVDALLRQTDAAMYQAKRRGKNSVVLYEKIGRAHV